MSLYVKIIKHEKQIYHVANVHTQMVVHYTSKDLQSDRTHYLVV